MNLQVNDQVEEENREKNESEAYADCGPGIPKPKTEGQEMDQREKIAQKAKERKFSIFTAKPQDITEIMNRYLED